MNLNQVMLAQGRETLKESFGFTEALFFELNLFMQAIKWEIGCSGFHYREWRGIFYPTSLPQKEWFKFYSERFNALELNSSFYQFPKPDSLRRWYDTSPEGFVFSVKAPRLITHYKRFSDCSSLLHDFYSSILGGLREKLASVLFQLPPNFNYSKDRFENILKGLSKDFQNVIEFRDQSWWIPRVFNTLRKQRISFCGTEYPGLPNDPVITGSPVYYRFHGRPRLYYSAYTRRDLQIVADQIAAHKKVSKALVFFNNTATAAAIKNAEWLKKYTQT